MWKNKSLNVMISGHVTGASLIVVKKKKVYPLFRCFNAHKKIKCITNLHGADEGKNFLKDLNFTYLTQKSLHHPVSLRKFIWVTSFYMRCKNKK